MEEAITKGFKRVIPNIKVSYSAWHLKERDGIKLDRVIEKATASAWEKSSSQSRDLERHIRTVEMVLLMILV